MIQALAPYRRFLAALAGAVLTSLAFAKTDNVITSPEVVMLATTAFGLMATYALPDTPVSRYMKLTANAALNALGLLGGWLAAGQDITTSMKLQLGIAVLSGLGIILVENAPEPAVPPTADLPARAA